MKWGGSGGAGAECSYGSASRPEKAVVNAVPPAAMTYVMDYGWRPFGRPGGRGYATVRCWCGVCRHSDPVLGVLGWVGGFSCYMVHVCSLSFIAAYG